MQKWSPAHATPRKFPRIRGNYFLAVQVIPDDAPDLGGPDETHPSSS